jgi:hypothetical protein
VDELVTSRGLRNLAVTPGGDQRQDAPPLQSRSNSSAVTSAKSTALFSVVRNHLGHGPSSVLTIEVEDHRPKRVMHGISVDMFSEK